MAWSPSAHDPELTDDALRSLLLDDPERGWPVFIERFTPMLLAVIERAGIVDHDEAMEVYVRLCERLWENRCARFRHYDPARGPLAAWLATALRHVVVDWVRAERGRRRMFRAIQRLDRFHQRVFELYYWDDRSPAEIAHLLGMESGSSIDLGAVLDALGQVDAVLSDRHRSDLLSYIARARGPISLTAQAGDRPIEVPDQAADPEARLAVKELGDRFQAALATLPAEDAAILRLKYGGGLSDREIQRALHLGQRVTQRVEGILATLRGLLVERAPWPSRTAAEGRST